MRQLLLVVTAFLLTQPAYAWRLLDADDVSLEGYRVLSNRDSYWDGASGNGRETWTQGAAANLRLTLLEWDWLRVYDDNRVHGESTDRQFREVGWEYEVGVALDRRVDLFWHHHSQHALDVQPDGHYPLQNLVGFRLHFVTKGNDRG